MLISHDFEVPPVGFVASLPNGVIPVDARLESPHNDGGTYRVSEPHRNKVTEASFQSLLYLPGYLLLAVDGWEYQLVSCAHFLDDNGTILMQLLLV